MPRGTEAGPVLPSPLDTAICRAPIRTVAAAGEDRLVFEGTHILAYGALRQIAKAYRGPLPLVVRGGGCDNAVAGVQQGGAHLGGMCCPPRGPRLEGLKSLVVAFDIKAVVTHPSLGLDDLSTESLRAIADGSIDDWAAVGGAPGPIALVVREHCWDYAEPVRSLLLPDRPIWSRRALMVTSDENVVDAVARFPRAIGVASWVFAKPLVEAGRLRLLSVDGVLPSIDSVQLGSYALAAPLSLIWSEWRPEMAPFFDFVYSRAGRAIIADRLVPVPAEDAGYSGHG